MNKTMQYESLRLENQLCFPLYAVSKEIIRRYKPYLDALDLTYTQYLVMMVLWEKGTINVKSLGEILYLDSGTLTPVLKKLEAKHYLKRSRSSKDERNLIISITPEGTALKEKAVTVPQRMASCIRLEPEEAKVMYDLLYRILGDFSVDGL